MEYRTLTADDVKVLRRADRIVVAYDSDVPSLTSVRAIVEHDKYDTDKRHEEIHEFNIPVTVYKSDIGVEPLPARGVKAFGFISLFPTLRRVDRRGQSNADSVVMFLKAGDRVRFEFRHHWLNNGYVVGANLHGDALYIEIERGPEKNPKCFSFEMDHAIAPNNSARMIKGVPDSAQYREEQARIRKEYWYDLNLPVKVC